MKKALIFIQIVYIFLFVCGSIFAVGERTISIGGEAGWRKAENRTGITEIRSVRPHPVLLLSSSPAASILGYSAASGVLGNFSSLSESAFDMAVLFDEREPSLFSDSVGHYRVSVPPEIEAVGRTHARAGAGAALFGRGDTSGALTIEPQSRNALFAAGNRFRDFTIEFWLYPLNMESGEQIVTWVASRPLGGNHVVQRISCSASRNRLQWSFINFFTSTNGSSNINIEISGTTPIVPRTWSHHLIRFDASTGMIEYLVDGSGEAIVYATSTGRENSEVYTPLAGNGGVFMLGERFMGLIDEFKLHSVCAGRSSLNRYNLSGGRMETGVIDLGDNSSGVLRVNVSGGRTSVRGLAVQNEFHENRRFRFADDSEMHFFVRASENPYLLNNSRWTAFTPGEAISGVHGRYVQLAVDFYPSADGESTPYLERMQIVYMPGEPPLPPRNLTAIAVDGGVTLRWRHSPVSNTSGYLVYYSTVRGELFGEGALLGSSPIDVGMTNNLLIDGLKNGTLYYFRVAAYERVSGEYSTGEFSAEVTARPLAGLSRNTE
ncbi:MAG: fibronectin type III domain-containing protein [Treponema sp.]|jgi:hypothetical protein|nr:fibronectin type III domain-containing protein [Treponema sp.]